MFYEYFSVLFLLSSQCNLSCCVFNLTGVCIAIGSNGGAFAIKLAMAFFPVGPCFWERSQGSCWQISSCVC